ncbi:MAG: kynureninase [Chloroflexi bacterium]|nr:kynureninase [Chloroflexota bacterium]
MDRPTTPPLAPTEAAARAADQADPMSGLRTRFHIPAAPDGTEAVYLAGHSLGVQPRDTRDAVLTQLDAWAVAGVEGHFRPGSQWVQADGVMREQAARIVGARPSEVVTMNTLTVNLHLLLASFFRPSGRRTQVIIDAPTFPSDRYAIESQLRHHGLDPAEHLRVMHPREGEATLRTDDLEAAIAEAGDRLALTLFAGVNYATGQVMDIPRLTRATHAVGAIAGWDLAHAAGNVPLSLHDADVDFAVWCTYKYLDSGPGAIAQAFVHERHGSDPSTPRLSGWWGNHPDTRFRMADTFDPGIGADGWKLSNPPILSLAPVAVSLAIFDEVGMTALRDRSQRLTGFLAECLATLAPSATILTPADPAQRGSMLSVRLPDARGTLAALETQGIIADFREPDIIRMAPVPMTNSYLDAWRAAAAVGAALGDTPQTGAASRTGDVPRDPVA